MSSDNQKQKSGSDSKKKEKENTKQKKASAAGHKKGESGVVAKSLTMTKISTPEKTALGSQKKSATKRKTKNDKSIDGKTVPRKPGRPRSISIASDAGKGKPRTLAGNRAKNTSIADYQTHNGNTESHKGIY